jgi:hypothetical protein
MNAEQRGVKKQGICLRVKRSKEGDMHAKTGVQGQSCTWNKQEYRRRRYDVKNRGQKGGDMHVKRRGAKGHTFETK